ncbi:hypothetical protein C8Q80DRAFT_643268 [Daedaleopsis nitida]|nr:hypothetical protein C8Q80DRAFT_643268 [Daedaleopsis nitida]
MPAPATDVNKQLETLGLSPEDFNEDAIRVAYKKLALRWHPDRHNAGPEEAKEKFIEVNDAYKSLVEECKKRSKRKPRKDEDSASARWPFWASSAPSASSSTSETPSASSSSSRTSATDTTAKETEKTEASSAKKPEESPPTIPTSDARSAKSGSPQSSHSSAKPKLDDNHTAQHRDSDKRDTPSDRTRPRRSGDRDSSHSSSRTERSHPRSSSTHTSSAAPKSPRPFKPSNLHCDTDSDSSSEAGSLHAHKPRHRHNERAKSKKHSLGEDDYEFIDLGTPLKPLRSPKPLSSSSKDWIFPLRLTLEDLYYGATHRYRITRTLSSTRSSESAHKSSRSHTPASKTQTVQIDVQVAPGWRTGTRIRVPAVGNQRADGSFQDIVFVVEEVPHARFERAGDDLVLSVHVPWADAHSRPYPPPPNLNGDDDSMLGDGGAGGGRYKFGFARWQHHGPAHEHVHEREEADDEVYVMGLDGEEYTLPIPRTLVEAADGTRIFGAGMPVRKNGAVVGKGDLVIR